MATPSAPDVHPSSSVWGDAADQQPTALDDFLFDVNGYQILRQAVPADLADRLDAEFDAFPARLPRGGWHRGGQRRDYTPETGFELHQAVAAGTPFEELIDHPSWIARVRRYAGEVDSHVEGVYIDESIASIRTAGGHHPVHSGGYHSPLRCAYGYANGVFRCGQVNIIVALTDVGPGDGATMVVPGSHKANLPHPLAGDYDRGDRMDALPGAVEIHLERGDALLFTDSLMHGGSSRTNPGERRVLIYRYGPAWGGSRFGYVYDPAWLATLSERRRRILEPRPPVHVGDPTVPTEIDG
ncbi:phytanoyl-CoA dioxygenase family protein [Micromonospora sp. NPDC051300]|uniref:phytanoyl-CoA dioxygenase family protein n=1 Tax=Micromonospora sp. NPDC051300 TaxID=3364286 RepID=UPI0037B76E4D